MARAETPRDAIGARADPQRDGGLRSSERERVLQQILLEQIQKAGVHRLRR
jgi:hypothetical protein